MIVTKFHENRLTIDGEIDEKHAIQFYQAEKIRDLVIIVTLACHLREYRSSLIFLVCLPL